MPAKRVHLHRDRRSNPKQRPSGPPADGNPSVGSSDLANLEPASPFKRPAPRAGGSDPREFTPDDLRDLAASRVPDEALTNIKRMRGWFLSQIRDRLIGEVAAIEATRRKPPARPAPIPAPLFPNLTGSLDASLAHGLDSFGEEPSDARAPSLSGGGDIGAIEESDEEPRVSAASTEEEEAPLVRQREEEEEEEEESGRSGRSGRSSHRSQPPTPTTPPQLDSGTEDEDWELPDETVKPVPVAQVPQAQPVPAKMRRTLGTGLFSTRIPLSDDDHFDGL
jgi:hypothetical protein